MKFPAQTKNLKDNKGHSGGMLYCYHVTGVTGGIRLGLSRMRHAYKATAILTNVILALGE